MNCPNCNVVQDRGAKFCPNCGHSLARSCHSCGGAVQISDRFCAECGTPLESSADSAIPADAAPGAPEIAEQRFVSVLFADIVGYTSFSETRDSEDIRDMLTQYFDQARAIIERFGGAVDKFIGDAVMGVWGATTAREDDAQRAVRAALDLVDMVAALGEEIGVSDLRLRAGVNSGRTSVGPGGNEKGLVVGDLVNTASRLQSIAEPGTVFVGSTTFEVTKSSIDYDDMGERKVKGKAEPVRAFKALRVASMVAGRAREETRHPPFVGREREMRLLKDGMAAVEAEQRARLISIIGEAGIGKTRLVEEFKNHIDGYRHTIYWHRGRSPSYGEGLTFWALGEIVRGRAGIVEGADPAQARRGLRSMLAEFVPAQEDRDWIEPRLAGLLGLSEMPAGSRPELFSALRSFFQRISERGPTVLVFEDLHWADPGLLDFIGELVERSPKHPILVITLARTDLLEKAPDWGSQHRSSTGTRLSPLPDEEMRALVSGYLSGVGVDVVDEIVRRVAGFPLYAVEVVRMLLGTGELVEEDSKFRYDGDLDAISIPDSLLTVIGARLDRLEPTTRSLLQDAAILGQTFTLDAISSLSNIDPDAAAEQLSPLISFEVLDLEDDPRSPERGQYAFVQGLIREVAYGRLGRDDRRAKHLAAAEYFEQFEDTELAGVVAGHYMGAFQATPSGEGKERLVERAVGSLVNAAGRAADLHSDLQAMNLLDEAIELAAPDRVAELQLLAAGSADRYGAVDRGIAYLTDARRYYEDHDDGHGVRRAVAAHSALLNGHFRSDAALELVEPVYEQLESLEDEVSVLLAAEAGRSLALNRRHDQALVAIDRLLPAAASLGLAETAIDSLITRALSLDHFGRNVEALVALRGAAAEARKRGLLAKAQRALNNIGAIMEERDPQEVIRINRENRELAIRAGDLRWIVRTTLDLAEKLGRSGLYDEASGLLEEVDTDDVSEWWRARVKCLRLRFRFRQTGSQDLRDEALAALTAFETESDPHATQYHLGARPEIWAEWGDWERALELSVQLDPDISPNGLRVATIAAGWLQERDRLATIAETSTAIPRLNVLAEALLHALEGERDTAAEVLTKLFESWEPMVLGDSFAQANAVAAFTVGTNNPFGAQAARVAYEWSMKTGSKCFLRAWAPVMPADSIGD